MPEKATSERPKNSGRLQRPPDFTGGQLTSFREIFYRHGLPGALLGAVFLLSPPMRSLLQTGLAPMQAKPPVYLFGGLAIFAALATYAWFVNGRQRPSQIRWMLYLGAVSAWEEWVFRLALPFTLTAQGVETKVAALIANLLFGALHYFTLRWKWHWCVLAFLGGMALSNRMANHLDLLLVIGIHWIATFANTPKPPEPSSRRD